MSSNVDEETLRWLAEESLRQAMELISTKLEEMADSPLLDGLTGKEAVLAASKAILSTNDKQWGIKGQES